MKNNTNNDKRTNSLSSTLNFFMNKLRKPVNEIIDDIDDSNYQEVKTKSDEEQYEEMKKRIAAANKKRIPTVQEKTAEQFKNADDSYQRAIKAMDIFGDIKKRKDEENKADKEIMDDDVAERVDRIKRLGRSTPNFKSKFRV